MDRCVEYILNLHIGTSSAAAGVIALIRKQSGIGGRLGLLAMGPAKESLLITGFIACVS